LKTVLAMSFVLGGKVKGETWIEARGIKHRILFTVNQIMQEPVVHDIRTRSRVTTGTRVTVFWPDTEAARVDADEIAALLTQFVWVNPHLTLLFIHNSKILLRHRATNLDWTKYRACDATSAHWYTRDQLKRYAGALIARDREYRKKHSNTARKKIMVRELVAQFRGMSATGKQKTILRELGASHMSLQRFFGSETRVNDERMEKLRCLLQEHTRPVRPELLGIIGDEHLRQLCTSAGGEPKSFKYFLSAAYDANGLPYLVEIATCPFKTWVAGRADRARHLITGVNFSATLDNPFQSLRRMEGMDEILVDLRAGPSAPVIVCVHYACPHIEYLDRGKSRIGLE
jgi:hypothetical protein